MDSARRASRKLTAAYVKSAAPGKHYDSDVRGFYVHVQKSGARYWRLRYFHAGREKLLALGVFPEVGLAEARQRAAKARSETWGGNDPNAVKAEKHATAKRAADATYPKVSLAWLDWKRKEWADGTYRKAHYINDAYLIPALRRTSVTTLTTKQAVDALESIPPSLAVKARQYLVGIVNYAIREGLRDEGRHINLRGALPTKGAKGHVPAAVSRADVTRVVLVVASYPVPVTKAALEIAMLTVQRPGNVAAMEWSELDLEASEWVIPGAKMKMGIGHVVPLPKQAVATLRSMLAYGKGTRYVFPPLARQKTLHLHRDSLSAALRAKGLQGKHATHGFRAMFRTVARERLNVHPDVLEAQLAHSKGGETNSAYDRAQFLQERRLVMQAWADYLDSIRKHDPGKEVAP